MKVTVVIPYVRDHLIDRCVNTTLMNSGLPTTEYRIMIKKDKQGIGLARMLNGMVALAPTQMVCFIGEDCVPQLHFLKNALRAMKTLPDEWGLVGLSDNTNRTDLACHYVADKRLIPLLGGELIHSGYKHCCSDLELTTRCREHNKFVYCKEAVVIHEHPLLNNKIPTDEIYKKIYSPEWVNHDNELYKKRLKSNWTYTERDS